jgi:hypothetical protein
MNSTYIIIAVVLILVIMGAIMAPNFILHKRSEKLHDQFGSEYDHTVKILGDEKKANAELVERQKRVNALNILPLSTSKREHYLADWAAIQSKFVDKPGEAVTDADDLIMEVMQLRAYPVSDFEQRAADVSVSYPAMVSKYRTAREISVKNERQEANTEELRQAMIHYRSLFEELLKPEIDIVMEK